ncbi:hypothetical protein ACFV2N_45255 [Streptomyces sp. NPDC059680]|uniref:hypothetical protein n=1 Tax=Streptomyces sp. NPDC059680 TaxID=3346904 RepID=UPI0036A44C62
MTAYAYSGEAIVVVGSTAIPVHAKLWKHYTQPYERWFGILVPDDPRVDLHPLRESDVLVLRLPSGNEGNFTGDWTVVAQVVVRIHIKGMSHPPF